MEEYRPPFIAYAYSLQESGSWSEPVTFHKASEAFLYCTLHHEETEEIRITDTNDFLILQMKSHMLYVPLPDGTVQAIPLDGDSIECIQKVVARDSITS